MRAGVPVPDHYSYPNSLVLINKLGITEYERWKAVETAAIHQRMVELTEHPIHGRFDLAHLQAIHRHLTQDLYVWGGVLRDTDTRPGGTGIAHCRPQFIVPEAERLFGILAERDYLRGLGADAFSDGLAWVWGETTAIHPFRDVNTRSQHIMFNQLARDAGWSIYWSHIPGDVFAHARTLAIVEDHTGIDALIRPNLRPLRTVDPRHQEPTSAQVRSFKARRTSRTPAELDRELNAARERRNLLPPPAPSERGDEPDNRHSGPTRSR